MVDDRDEYGGDTCPLAEWLAAFGWLILAGIVGYCIVKAYIGAK